ncbi:MAG: sulfatase-like hydrolase/transferase [Ruminococcus sp.]
MSGFYGQNPDYVYTISAQGHGAYPEEQLILTIRRSQFPVLATDELRTVSGSTTVNQIHEMDQFVKELTDALADYPEDVILVMYGDHLPTMGLTVEDLKNKYLFQTQYVMLG